jgi:hypothetical protein
MKTVWKYILDVVDYQQIDMPRGAEILSVQAQGGTACIWVLVDPTNDKELRGVHMHGTGHPIDIAGHGRFVGTFQLLDGRLVLHLWEAA